MKKAITVLTVISILLFNSTSISAASGPKDVEVILSNVPEVVNVGKTVTLTVTTEKHGSAYKDNWSAAVKSVTTLDTITGKYISKGEFFAEKPGVYNISYNIDMLAGKSNVVFRGKVEKTIKVINPVTIAGAEIRDLEIKPVYKADGSISAYSAYGVVYSLWSDQTATPYSSVFFLFSPSETVKDVNVNIIHDGVQYKYVITVKR